jgi:regulator of replication initiation timing
MRVDLSIFSRGTRMAKQAVARSVDLEPIDRLEEKIQLLVNMVTRLRDEQAKSVEERDRLAQEVTSLRARLADAESTSTELTALREERDLIRDRVAEMLAQLETI